jgi:hypothetical protein
MLRLLLLICLALLTTGSASARTWFVKPDSTGDVPTIAVAVDSAAAQGDTVLLGNGTFTGPGNREIDCLDKALVITSKSGDPELCTIDCGFTYPGETNTAFHFRALEHDVARLEGITITHGCNGVACHDGAAPVISNCVFRDNHCFGAEIGPGGGGVKCNPGSSPLIIDCVFLNNNADGGGGVSSIESSPTIVNSLFSGNGAGVGGGVETIDGLPRIINSTFSKNFAGANPFIDHGGGGVYCSGSAEITDCTFDGNSCFGPGGGLQYAPLSASHLLTLTGCVFSGNKALRSNVENWGGGICVGIEYSEFPGEMVIMNCTFSGNFIEPPNCGSAITILSPVDVLLENSVIAFGGGGGSVCCSWWGHTPIVQCTDIYGNADGDWVDCIAPLNGLYGNFSADPKFCDTLSGYFWLEDCSPCLPDHHPYGHECGDVIGAFGSGCACGSATEPTTWGAIKSRYR